jgi:lipid II:glycine glycyltransferase (peptidoglycan interpeptide bridge formation enzyme)
MKISVELVELRDLEDSESLLQSEFWGAFREQLGWQARAFRCRYREQAFFLLVLIRELKLRLRLAYVPHGPEVGQPVADREGFLVELSQALRPYLPRCVFLRFDLPWGRKGVGNYPEALKSSAGLCKAGMDVQPPSTVILDLKAEEGELLAAMKSKTRYNIRLAARKDVEVSIARPQPTETRSIEPALAEWYRLYKETARRDRITLHSENYYNRLFTLAGNYDTGGPELYLLTARHEGELLAGIVLALKGRRAWYLYGASSDRKRNLMPSYALQWRAILLAKERGCRCYDLFGIPPEDDPRHPMHGLFRFKTGFGGQVVNRLGCYDLPYYPLLYRLYRLAEGMRSVYFRRWRKKLRRG